ncbi:MAG: hypothetical protein H8E14_12185 [Candidatus Marinimicrobia bacterium]|nr:hypothetical protein [Candidatus Neomarinimicrobiota bacterium]
MLISWTFKCETCGKQNNKPVKLSDSQYDWVCDCGTPNVEIFGSTITTGFKLILRSQYELNEIRDYNLSIVFSAMAVDCELSRLFIKWEKIKSLRDYKLPDGEKIESLLRQYPRISKKLKKVCDILYTEGIQDFFYRNPDIEISLAKLIENFSPKSFYKDIEKNLFWIRNRIVHLGDSSFKHEDAAQCHNIANILLGILNRMDLSKREQTL